MSYEDYPMGNPTSNIWWNTSTGVATTIAPTSTYIVGATYADDPISFDDLNAINTLLRQEKITREELMDVIARYIRIKYEHTEE